MGINREYQKSNGDFKKGNPGKPLGTKNMSTLVCDALACEAHEILTSPERLKAIKDEKIIEFALKGMPKQLTITNRDSDGMKALAKWQELQAYFKGKEDEKSEAKEEQD